MEEAANEVAAVSTGTDPEGAAATVAGTTGATTNNGTIQDTAAPQEHAATDHKSRCALNAGNTLITNRASSVTIAEKSTSPKEEKTQA